MEINTDVIVVGAGLTGLTTAYYLKKGNRKFVVIDKDSKPGGVIKTTVERGFIYEEGPNTGVIGNTTVVELFEELKDKCELEVPGDLVNKRYVLKNGKWEALPSGLIGGIKTPLFSFKDKIRILGEPFRAPGKDPHENLSGLVRRRMGESFLNYAVDPFVIGVYAGDPDYLITKYALPKLYNLEHDYGSFIGGSVKKGFEKKTPLEKQVTRKVFSFKNGLTSLTNALYSSANPDNFILGAKDIIINPAENGYILRYQNDKGENISINAKEVITTVGAFALDTMLPFIDKGAMSKLNSLLYTKVLEIAIGFNNWQGRKLDGFGGLIPFKEKREILGILFMSSLFEKRTPEGGALLSIFMGGVRRQDIMEMHDGEIIKALEKECNDLLSIKKFNPDLFKIIRHDWAIPQYGIESGERFETIKLLQAKYKGLQIGGNLRDGIGMADRMKQGKNLANSIEN